MPKTEAEIVRASILAWDPDQEFSVDDLCATFYRDDEIPDTAEVIVQLAMLVDDGYVIHVPWIRGMYRLAVVEAPDSIDRARPNLQNIISDIEKSRQ